MKNNYIVLVEGVSHLFFITLIFLLGVNASKVVLGSIFSLSIGLAAISAWLKGNKQNIFDHKMVSLFIEGMSLLAALISYFFLNLDTEWFLLILIIITGGITRTLKSNRTDKYA